MNDTEHSSSRRTPRIPFGSVVAIGAGVATALAVAFGRAGPAPSAAHAPDTTLTGDTLVKPTLIASTEGFAPGGHGSVIAVAFDIHPGWHTYWRNAGDSGAPPTFEFTIDPPGAVTLSEPMWPTPERHDEPGGIVDYVYHDRALHLFEVKQTDPAFKPGDKVKITCDVSWLVCKDRCLNGSGRCSLEWSCTQAPKPSDFKVEIDKALLTIPAPWSSAQGRVTAAWNGRQLRLHAPGAASISFFPFADEDDLVPINLTEGGSSRSSTITLAFDPDVPRLTGSVRGVVVAHGIGNRPGYGPSYASFVLDMPPP